MRPIAVDQLVPRTRSSHIQCRKPDSELRVQKGTSDHILTSVPLIPKFARECAASVGELRNWDTARQSLSPDASATHRAARDENHANHLVRPFRFPPRFFRPGGAD